jgi:hypothetical protein
MTYCAGCRKSVNHRAGIGGALRGEAIDFIAKYPIRDPVTIYFCKECWEHLQALGVIQK